MLAAIGGATNATAQTVTREETVRSVRKMLERLPYYGVFDFIVFRVDRGAVYLAGYSFEEASEDGRGSRHSTSERRPRSGEQD